MKKILLFGILEVFFFVQTVSAQNIKIGVDTVITPGLMFEVDGNLGAPNVIKTISLYSGGNYFVNNTSGANIPGMINSLEPTSVRSDGEVEIRLIICITGATGTNEFQLRSNDNTGDTYPIACSSCGTSWTYPYTGTSNTAISEWKSWSAGTNMREIQLFYWNSASGGCTIRNAYIEIRPKRN